MPLSTWNASHIFDIIQWYKSISQRPTLTLFKVESLCKRSTQNKLQLLQRGLRWSETPLRTCRLNSGLFRDHTINSQLHTSRFIIWLKLNIFYCMKRWNLLFTNFTWTSWQTFDNFWNEKLINIEPNWVHNSCL